MNTFELYCRNAQGRPIIEKWNVMQAEEQVPCPLCGEAAQDLIYALGQMNAVRCASCRFKYVSPQLTNEQLGEYYGQMYGKEMFQRDFEGRKHDFFGDPVERAKKIQDRHIEIELTDRFSSSARILDVGAGSGLYFEGLKGDHQLHGIELSSMAATYVEEHFVAEIKQCDVMEADYEKASFDVVNMTYIIEHLKDPKTVMAKAVSWLRPGGLLLVSSPNWGGPMARLFGQLFRLNDPCMHISLWEPATLRPFLEDCNLRVERVHFPFFRTEYFNGYELWRLLANSSVRLALPTLVRLGVFPAPKHVLSPPFWGSIMVAEAYKKSD